MSNRGSHVSHPPSIFKSAALVSLVSQSESTSSPGLHQVGNNAPMSPPSRKTKHRSSPFPVADLLKSAINVKPQFSSLFSGPETSLILKPLMLLSREHLPLSSLDLSDPHGEFPSGPGRFFESRIRVLDLEGRLRQVPSLLIARSDNTRHLYAIERSQGLYVVCKLGPWVSLDDLSLHAEACHEQRCRPARTTPVHLPEAPSITPQLHKETKKKRVAIEEIQSMVRKRPRTLSVTPCDAHPLHAQLQTGISNPANPLLLRDRTIRTPPAAGGANPSLCRALSDVNHVDTQAPAKDIFNNIRCQYSGALYHSKGSLAYFAKGPLSRARAAFHVDCDANLDMKDLTDFLRSLVMTISQIDKKYRDTLPKLVEDSKMLTESSAEDETRRSRAKSKKMKLGKDGLYPGEVRHVQRWCRAHGPLLHAGDKDAAILDETKYSITYLRKRETQLQMIIILEILALEAVWPIENSQHLKLPGMPAQGIPPETVESVPKKRNKHNLLTLVDVHADRLCIWQSTTLDDMKIVLPGLQPNNGQEEAQEPARTTSDFLKDFCRDILLPFFAGRLPDLCESLTHKFGGLVVVSPPKPKKKPVAAKASRRPGAVTQRPVSTRAPKSLDKVLSHDQLKRKAARRPTTDLLARMRSATPATVPGLKREASEPICLANMPSRVMPPKEASKNIMSGSVSRPDVDGQKAQKKANLDAELKDAISGLKKPNTQLEGRNLVEEAEKRAGSLHLTRPRKPKKPARLNTAARPQVQVKATPVNYRFRDAVSAAEHQSRDGFKNSSLRSELDQLPFRPMILSTAPRTCLRSGQEVVQIASTSVEINAQANTVPGPTAALPYYLKPPTTQSSVPPSSTPVSKNTAVAVQPPLDGSRTDTGLSSPYLTRLSQTPLRQTSCTTCTTMMDKTPTSTHEPRNPTVCFATSAGKVAALSAVTGEANDDSRPALTVYQQLGWDDYDMDEITL